MKKFIFLIAGYLMIMASCTDKTEQNLPAVYRINVKLVDSSANYQEVNIDIADVLYNVKGDSLGWVSFMMLNKGVYNILNFTGGVDTMLGTIEANSIVKQIRFVLGKNNSIKVDNVTYPLFTPSGQQSGIKLNLDTNLVQGITYTFWLDFDVTKSIVKTGNNKYILKPVIRLTTKAESGSIKGKVSPAAAGYPVSAYNATDTFQTFTNVTGDFLLMGIPPNTYTLTISPNGSYPDTLISNINVIMGQQTNIGTIVF